MSILWVRVFLSFKMGQNQFFGSFSLRPENWTNVIDQGFLREFDIGSSFKCC